MSKLYVIRHGMTDWNDLKLIQGTTDIDLNEQGDKETKRLASTLDLSNIDICLCSPLKRTKITAEILMQEKIKIIYDDLIIERGYGEYEGKKIDMKLIAKQWDYQLNDSSNKVESIKDCLARAEKFLKKIKKEYPDKNILIVTHGGFMKALHFTIKGYDENTDFLSFYPQNSEVHEYDI